MASSLSVTTNGTKTSAKWPSGYSHVTDTPDLVITSSFLSAATTPYFTLPRRRGARSQFAATHLLADQALDAGLVKANGII